MNEKIYTEEDIGTEVRSVIEGIEHYDEVIEVWLPNGYRIIGPSLKCGHIFARFTMIPTMLEASEKIQEFYAHLDATEGDEQ